MTWGLGWVAEQERTTLIARTKAGIERARRQGKTLGRPKASPILLHAASIGFPRIDSVGRRYWLTPMSRLQDCLRTTAAMALMSLACGGSPSRPQPTPSAVIIVSGDQQTGTVGQELPQALVVRVVDANLSPIAGQIINFMVGSKLADTAISDANGIAQERWTLGPQLGPQGLEAQAVDSMTGNAIVFATFKATAIADAPAYVPVLEGDRQTASPGTALPIAIRVQAQDKYGNPVAGQAVQFAPTVGTGSVAPSTATTDSSGEAVTVWTLGPEQGLQRLGVYAGTAKAILAANANSLSATSILVTPDLVGINECNEIPTPLSFAWAVSGAPAYDLFASNQAGCPPPGPSAPNAKVQAIASNIISSGYQGSVTVAVVLSAIGIGCYEPATAYFCLFPSGTGTYAVPAATGTLLLAP